VPQLNLIFLCPLFFPVDLHLFLTHFSLRSSFNNIQNAVGIPEDPMYGARRSPVGEIAEEMQRRNGGMYVLLGFEPRMGVLGCVACCTFLLCPKGRRGGRAIKAHVSQR